MDINERIALVREESKLSMEKFGNKIGISRVGVSLIEKGTNRPSRQTIDLICREFNVNKEWLETGEGEMYRIMSKYDYIARLTADLMKQKPDSFKNRFVKALSELSEEDWEALEAFAKKISEP